MRIDTTKEEQTFSSLSAGLSMFVMNALNEYEEKQRVLIEEIQKLREENEKLKAGKEEEK